MHLKNEKGQSLIECLVVSGALIFIVSCLFTTILLGILFFVSDKKTYEALLCSTHLGPNEKCSSIWKSSLSFLPVIKNRGEIQFEQKAEIILVKTIIHLPMQKKIQIEKSMHRSLEKN